MSLRNLTPKAIRDDNQTRFDVFNPTGQVKKFMINRMVKGDETLWFVAHLSEGKERPFEYIGMLNGWNGDLAITHKSTYEDGHPIVKVCRAGLGAIYEKLLLPKGFRVERHATPKPPESV